jgi:Domain of unknown function (DUF4159)/Aerotolerance regulator N-terminal
MNLLPGLSFGVPWLLWGLAVLPVIYWLLRVTPPAPRRVVFPPLRLLLGLEAPQETPARTPLWLLLLRLVAAALVIAALAQPTIGQSAKIPGRGPLVLFVDNDWAAAHAWKDREAEISDALADASHSGRAVAIVPTATATPPVVSLLDAGEAARDARDLDPKAWLPDRARAAAVLAKTKFDTAPEIFWLSDGLDYGDAAATASTLEKTGDLKVFSDAPGNGPLALVSERSEPDGFLVTLRRASAAGMREGNVDALGAQGESLAAAHFKFANGADETAAKIVLPLEVRNETDRIVVVNEDSAGAVRLLGTGAKRRAVELVSAGNAESEQPLLSGSFYLQRALAPYAEVRKGSIEDAVARNASVIVLADIGNLSGTDHDQAARFIEGGGVLLRFAGGRMTANVDDLVPVKLRVGGRYLGGALAWAEPQHLAPFPDASPFRGLAIPPEVTVSRQVLAEPSVELGERTWARLADGTPLVTASQRGKGWIVLFHVTASPAWSSLPLSGLYVDMLRRVLDLAGGARPSEMGTDASAVFPPAATLDGFGQLGRPSSDAQPIRGSELAKLKASPKHPPGFYGGEGAQIALNAADDDTILTPLGDPGASVSVYAGVSVLQLEAPLLALAIAILMADALISLWLRGYIDATRSRLAARIGMALLCIGIVAPRGAHADDSFDMKAALDTRLAYVVTGLGDVDEMSKAGLTGLGLALKSRTSYEPQEPVGVNLDKDDLSFFPLLYWPMDPREKDLSPDVIAKIAAYMRNGGTILFDTRDLTLGAERGANSPGEATLRRLIAKLDLPPLEPVPPDHVLTKTFYLLQDFPGRWDGGKVWVEALPPPDPDAGPEPARGGDGVSPVIIGGNDWAAAWAVDAQGRPLAEVTPGGDEQREMAIRFGINVVMYALTGNYKTDQVHAPALLQRLGH